MHVRRTIYQDMVAVAPSKTEVSAVGGWCTESVACTKDICGVEMLSSGQCDKQVLDQKAPRLTFMYSSNATGCPPVCVESTWWSSIGLQWHAQSNH